MEPSETKKPRTKGVRTGKVRSVSGAKTVSVVLENLVKHAQYGKYLRRRSHVAVHDPQQLAQVGDVVEIVPCRPISKSKSWRLVRIVRRPDLVVTSSTDRG